MDDEERADRRKHDRVLMARIAAAERWGRTADRVAATEPARRGLRAKFEREADPDGTLPIHERARRADQLMQAHMMRMSRAASRARRASRASRKIGESSSVDPRRDGLSRS